MYKIKIVVKVHFGCCGLLYVHAQEQYCGCYQREQQYNEGVQLTILK